MNPQISKIYGLYNQDGRGYNVGEAISFYPIRAAAEAAKGDNNYLNISCEESLRFEDALYLLEEGLPKDVTIVGKIPAFVPAAVYQDYRTNNYHNDTSIYYLNEKDFLEALELNKHCAVYKKIMICDTEGNFYLLKQAKPIIVEKLVMSRELATKHALSKLTDEEKKLLGL